MKARIQGVQNFVRYKLIENIILKKYVTYNFDHSVCFILTREVNAGRCDRNQNIRFRVQCYTL